MVKRIIFVTLVAFGLVFCGMAGECSGDVAEKFEQAERYEEDGNHEQAEAIYKAILTDYPGTNDALTAQEKLTMLYVGWGKEPEAKAAFEKLFADFSEHEHLAKAVDHVADKYRKLGKYEKARELHQYVVDTWPQSEHAAESQKGVVTSSILLGDDPNAQAAIDKLVGDFPGDDDVAEMVREIADEYRELEKYERARELYRKVVETWPNCEQAIWSQKAVANVSIELGDEAGAQAAVDRLIADFSQNKNLAKAVDSVADRYRQVGKYEKARELHRYVVDTWPQSEHAVESQKGVVTSSILLGDDPNAQAAIDKLVGDFPGDDDVAEMVREIADEYRGLERYEKAVELYRYVVDHWPKAEQAIKAQTAIANLYIALGDDPNVQAATEELSARFSGHKYMAREVDWLAGRYWKLREYGKARELYQYIVDSWPEAERARQAQMDAAVSNVLSLSIELGKEIEAQKALETLIVDHNDNTGLPKAIFRVGEGYYNEAFLCENEGFESESKVYFRKAIGVWERIVTELPKSDITAPAYHFAGNCYRRLGMYEKAIEYYQRIVADWPDYEYAGVAQFLIGHSYKRLKLAGTVAESEADAEIKAAYERVLKEYPNSPFVKAARNWLNYCGESCEGEQK